MDLKSKCHPKYIEYNDRGLGGVELLLANSRAAFFLDWFGNIVAAAAAVGY